MVSTYLIGDGTKPVSSVLSTWRAHRYSAITAMAVTSWGELWTGSSKGSLRIWSDALNPRMHLHLNLTWKCELSSLCAFGYERNVLGVHSKACIYSAGY